MKQTKRETKKNFPTDNELGRNNNRIIGICTNAAGFAPC